MGVAYQTIGMIGSFVIASSLVPQMHKVYKTRSAKDISLRFQLLYCFGIGLILVYGFGENLWPIYIPASVEELAGIVMLAMKLYYDREATKPGASGANDESHALELGASPLTRRSETKFTGVVHTPRADIHAVERTKHWTTIFGEHPKDRPDRRLHVSLPNPLRTPTDTDTMSQVFQILGFMGSLLLAASLVPQMRKLYQTKSAKDISLVYQISYVVGLAMIVAYGFGRWLWPVYIPATLELCAAIVVFSMKLYYDAQDRKRDGSKNTGTSPEVEASAVSRSQFGEATRAQL